MEEAEVWSEAVKAEWVQIANAFATSGAGKTETPASVANRIEMIDPGKLRAKELYDGQPIKVVELSAPDAQLPGAVIQAEPGDFIRRIRELLFLSSEKGEPAVRFKVFGIDRNGGQLKTRQRLTARGSRAGKAVRSLAVVDATWEMPTGNGPPRLVGFFMPKLIQSELISEATVFLEDIAGAVLGGNPAWREQLRPGMNTWVRRIERSLKPDFLGYHGLAVGDVDGDGLEDLYLCQPGGLPNLLFRQHADGSMRDISTAAGVDWLDNSTGALLVDLDNDGDPDLAIATHRAFLVMENDGAGKFSLRTPLANIGLGYSPTAADYDLDGDLDLLVLRYSADSKATGDFPTPHPFYDARNGGANVLLENQGGFRFADVTEASGLGVGNFRFSFAASWEDYDNDGDADLYIANDFGPKNLFRNDRGKFVDVALESGAQDWGFGMSATWADYDRDGDMDLYASNMFSGAGNKIVPQADFNPSMPGETRAKYLKMVRGNTLLRNLGDGRFSDVTDPMAEGFGSWAWGAKFADFNNDGWEDLYVANGYISQPDKDDL
jgi:FG-GAP-like repeat